MIDCYNIFPLRQISRLVIIVIYIDVEKIKYLSKTYKKYIFRLPDYFSCSQSFEFPGSGSGNQSVSK